MRPPASNRDPRYRSKIAACRCGWSWKFVITSAKIELRCNWFSKFAIANYKIKWVTGNMSNIRLRWFRWDMWQASRLQRWKNLRKFLFSNKSEKNFINNFWYKVIFRIPYKIQKRFIYSNWTTVLFHLYFDKLNKNYFPFIFIK